MGIQVICDAGYVTLRCRCPREHYPPDVVKCIHRPTEHEQHNIYDRADEVLQRRHCPRCWVRHNRRDFRGDVCGWCADDMEYLL